MGRKVLNSYETYTIMGNNQRERNLMLRHITLMVIVSVQRLNTLYHLDQKDRLRRRGNVPESHALKGAQTVKNFYFYVQHRSYENIRFLNG